MAIFNSRQSVSGIPLLDIVRHVACLNLPEEGRFRERWRCSAGIKWIQFRQVSKQELDSSGQPTQNIIERRRRAEFITPIPKPNPRRECPLLSNRRAFLKRAKDFQPQNNTYDPTSIINEVRQNIDQWRALSSPNQWQVTPDTARLLELMFGSRQEEAQRLGRILRPKQGDNQAHFYSIVSRDTVEQDFALNRNCSCASRVTNTES